MKTAIITLERPLRREQIFALEAVWRIALVCFALCVVSCSTPQRLPAVPASLASHAHFQLGELRYIPGVNDQQFEDEYVQSLKQEEGYLRSQGHDGPLPPTSFLALSGGGGDGAFGAGLITGWTDHGRPVFKVVTGISTGALIAPFAFLGPKYDPLLRQTFTTSTDANIFKKRSLIGGITGDAMADTLPLQGIINHVITPEFLAEIAAEYAKGRLLLIGTTDLDAQRPVIWNMTALAASRSPDAIALFRKILLASAAIPGAFPPVMIDVTIDGKKYQEMHVDGGATAQIFIYPPGFHLDEVAAEHGYDRQRSLYIIRNARLDTKWSQTKRRTLNIATNAIATLIQTQGTGDLYRMYLKASRDNLDYNLAYIPPDFDMVSKSQFDKEYMTKLFARGHDMAASGYPWQKYPPGFGARQAAK